jgi:HD-GYP domain-containing protein (c-di-GMP phosphodiesterase class II)
MRWLNIKEVSSGMVLAKDMSVSGKKLLKGIKITDEILQLFKENNVIWIPIKIKTLSDNELDMIEISTEGEISKDDFQKVLVKQPDYIKERSEIPEELFEEIENISFELIDDVRSGERIRKEEVQETMKNIVDNVKFKENTRSVILEKTKRYDAYTFTHMVNVSLLSVLIGMQMGIDKEDLVALGQGGLLHDTGKTRISIEIINKRGKLDPEELKQMRNHPLYGRDILLESGIRDEKILAPVLQHHEKVDGSGYPSGLKEDSIHFFAKIAAVADIYDALTTVRSYKKAMIPYKAVSIILSMIKHFDPKVIKAFVDLMGIYPVGTRMRLSNGEIATVIETNVTSPLRPVVIVESNLDIIDLSKDNKLLINRIFENEEDVG